MLLITNSMTIKNTLCTLVAVAAIGLGGCSERPVEEIATKDITISGKPISVAYNPNTHSEYGAFAAVFDVEGKMLLTYKKGSNMQLRGLSGVKATALIQSEIDDGDDESVKLTGQYRGNEFELSSIEANGYKVNF